MTLMTDNLKESKSRDEKELQGILSNLNSSYESSKTIEITDNDDPEIISSNNLCRLIFLF